MLLQRTELSDHRVSAYFRALLLLLSLLIFSGSKSYSQVGQLELSGRCVKDGKPLPGAIVTVFRNGTIEQEKAKVGKNGKFRFYLVFGFDYKVTFSAPGCVDMHLMVYTGRLAKERSDLFPLYETEVPFFEPGSKGVRVAKFKSPFTKIIFDGKKAFMDDEAYLAAFTKDLIIDAAEQARIQAEKEAKEKAEKEKLEAIEKAKKDAEEKLRKEEEARLLAEQKAREDAAARESELARLKAESERSKPGEDETMETEAMRLQREKEEKAKLAKQNKEIKTKYVNDLLRLVAENERTAKQREFNKEKSDARTNTVIEQMRRESELKAKAENLREEKKAKEKKLLENKQTKTTEMRKLVEAAAFAERSVRINKQNTLPDVKGYKRAESPNVSVTVDEGVIKTVRTTVVQKDRTLITYIKETYFWGTISCTRDGVEIDEATYNVEIDYYSAFKEIKR
jgi:hypothetical protein